MISRSLVAGVLFCVACSGARQNEASSVPMPAFAVSQQIATDEIRAPWSLTATDGSGLVLTRVDAKAVFEGPLAFTELHLYFHNPEDRVREGTFAITLPNRAAVSRFAMENNGQWMEAEVVEKLVARRAYEDFLHRKQDPALLEKAEGNQFTARVFPIPAKGDKHLVLSFSQELPGERYALPLRGLPKTERVDVRMTMLDPNGKRVDQILSERDWQPDRDFVSNAPVTAEAVGNGRLIATQLAVLDATGAMPAADAPTAMTILVDTSASRTLGFAAMAARLEDMIGQLRKRHGDLQLQVLAYDQETQLLFAGKASEWSAKTKQALLDRGAAGASDLGQAIAWLAAHDHHNRLVVLGDGVITAGAKPEQVVAQIKQLKGVERVDVVLSGGLRDDQVAGQLVSAATRPGAVLDLDTGSEHVTAALAERMLTNVAVEVTGASWVYPRVIPAVRAGSRVMVYARMPSATQTLTATINGHQRAVPVVAGTPALLDRAAAATEINELERRLANATGDTKQLRDEIAKKSVAARVISSQTSLLVLETEADYTRFGIDRLALTDILEVTKDGLVTRNRKGKAPLEIASPVKPTKNAVTKKKELQKELETLEKDSDLGEGKMGKLSEREDDGDAGPAMKSRSLEVAPDEPERAIAPKPAEAPMAEPAPELSRSLRRRPMVDGRASSGRAVVAADEDSADDGGEDERMAWPPKDKPAALQGELANIVKLISKRDTNAALVAARAWHAKEPGNVLAWIGLGETLEARKELAAAARAYGSIIDLFPGRADLRRWAGERLERIGAQARGLAIDSYQRAVADRPDHMTGHRLLAYALLRAGKHAEAFAAILAGVEQKYPDGRFAGGDRILGEDAGMIGAAYAAAVPAKRAEIAATLQKHKLSLSTAPSTRFVLYWETDANDVDFHIQDAKGGHAFYSSKKLPSGGELYEDVTTGYGPECFAIPGNAKAGPYRLSIDYYSQGPMGYGMGLLQIVRHDGKGKLAFEDRPYIIMADHAYVDLGSFK